MDAVEGAKIITIRRPQAINALNDEVTGEILAVLKEYHDDPSVKGFVITGNGKKAFSAGAEIGKFPEMLGNSDASVRYARDCAQVQLFMDEVKKIQGEIKRIPEGNVAIPEIALPDEPMAGKQALSKEAVSLVIKAGAAADSFSEALEIGYRGFGQVVCTDAAKEGISAFLEKRKPEFRK